MFLIQIQFIKLLTYFFRTIYNLF